MCMCVYAAEPQKPVEMLLPEASAGHLPRWRGFNLLNQFNAGSPQRDRPFEESDFAMIKELGSNFVRLPMDYRCWIVDGDWEQLDETVLARIDQAVGWGQKYGIHVSLNFHRAPGYTVAKPAEKTSLWSDEKTQDICAMHWAEFARRYRGIPSSQLSFNLFNEPNGVSAEVYAQVVNKIIIAIRQQDSNRLIICDGIKWGTQPVAELAPLDVAMSTHCYKPMNVTHYKASWVDAKDYAQPTWPIAVAFGTLYAPGKSGIQEACFEPMTIDGAFNQPTALRLHVDTVSNHATLLVQADDHTLLEKAFVCGPGEGEWKESKHMPQWDTYQCVYDRDYVVTIPADSSKVTVAVTQGDWLRISQIGFTTPSKSEHIQDLRNGWDKPAAHLTYQPQVGKPFFVSRKFEDRQWLKDQTMLPWLEFQKLHQVGIMVGEFGVYNHTPHDVALSWIKDCLNNWKEANWGWALWEFRGTFGILDSERSDVEYEDFHGHKLDRKMLELLQRY